MSSTTNWIPRSHGTSLYIRPTMVATEPYIGLKSTHEALFFIITGPVGAYYPEGFNPVKITVSEQYSRAGPGGLGSAKTAANYAASLKAEKEALARGFTQVLWLDAAERRYVEEVGSMNILFKIGGTVVTPPVGETILAGITKDSVLKLLGQWGVPAEERPITIEELLDAHTDGSLEEVFGAGTAAVISPVGSLDYKGRDAACRERWHRTVRGAALRRADGHPVRNPTGLLRLDPRGGAHRHGRPVPRERLSRNRTEHRRAFRLDTAKKCNILPLDIRLRDRRRTRVPMGPAGVRVPQCGMPRGDHRKTCRE